MLEFELDDADTAFVEANVNYEITDVKLFANMHTVDNARANSYAVHVLNGNPLHIHFSSVVASRHLVNGNDFSISMVRGFTRLKQCLFVFITAGGKPTRQFHSPFNQAYDTDTGNFEWQVTI